MMRLMALVTTACTAYAIVGGLDGMALVGCGLTALNVLLSLVPVKPPERKD